MPTELAGQQPRKRTSQYNIDLINSRLPREQVARVLLKRKKEFARAALCRAVKDGRVTRPSTCGRCGGSETRIEGHHANYDLPYDVEWLCRRCHRKTHRETA